MERDKEPGGGGPIIAGVAMVACCALPMLLVSGGVGAIAGWFAGGGWIWPVLAAVAVGAGVLYRRRGPQRAALRAPERRPEAALQRGKQAPGASRSERGD